MGDDEAEMQQLRQAQQFRKHQISYGDRAAVKKQREAQEAAAEQARDDARLAYLQSLAASRQQQQQAEEDDGVELAGEDAPDPTARRSAARPSARDDDDDEEDEVGAGFAGADDDPSLAYMRSMLPMSFGSASKNREAEKRASAAALTSKSVRATVPAAKPTTVAGKPVAGKPAAAAAAGGKKMAISITLKTSALPTAPAASSSSSSSSASASSSSSSSSSTAAAGSSTGAGTGGSNGDIPPFPTLPADDDDDDYGPKPPPQSDEKEEDKQEEDGEAVAMEAEEEDEESEDDEVNNIYQVPLSHEAVVRSASKAITALAVDPSGARFMAGGLDYSVRMYDFAGMTSNFNHFREIEPEHGYTVECAEYSKDGSAFMLCSSSCRPKLYERDGVETCQFIKGDVYLQDLRHTKGHVMGVTAGHWHPTDKSTVLTSSLDGTLRLWDVSKAMDRNKHVIKFSKGIQKVPVRACAFSPNGNLIAGGGNDGAIRIWDTKAASGVQREALKMDTAHARGSAISCLTFSRDNATLLSRGCDHTLKVWDTRKFGQPLKVIEQLQNMYEQTDVIFSPNEQIIVTATSSLAAPDANNKAKAKKGSLMFYNRRNFELMQQVRLSDVAAIKVAWHSHINQLIVSGADGTVQVLFNPKTSRKGALLCVGKKPKKKDITDFLDVVDVHTPHALPLFADVKKRKLSKLRQDPVQTKKPEPPLNKQGRGGRIGSSFKKFMVANFVPPKEEADPRAALLAYDELTKQDPMFFGKAYAATQPKPILADKTIEEEEDAKEVNFAIEDANKRRG